MTTYKIPLPLKLAALWTSMMFCFVYGDYLGLYVPGVLDGIRSANTPLGETTPALLLAFALSMAIPALMIAASVFLRPGPNRWLNLIVGSLYLLIILSTLFTTGLWSLFYLFLGILEGIIALTVIYKAWKWPRINVDSLMR